MKTLLLSFLLVSAFIAFGQTAPGIEWQKTYGGSNADGVYCINKTPDGGYIMSGVSFSNDGDISTSGDTSFGDWWIVKLNNLGNIQWQKMLGGSKLDFPSSIQPTPDGGYIIVGYSTSDDGDISGHHGPTIYFDYWVVKLSSLGEIQWEKSLGGTDGDVANSVQLTADGGYIVAGYSASTDGDITGHHGLAGSRDYWIVKLTGSGEIQWQKSLGGTGNEYAESISTTTDGGYVVVGYSGSTDGDVTGHHGLADSVDCWVVKLTGRGEIQWQKSLGGSNEEAGSFIQSTADGGYILAGFTNSTDGDITGHHGTDYNNDYWIVKLTAAGEIQWEKCFGGSDEDDATAIQATGDGYIVAGQSFSGDGDITGHHEGLPNTDGWVVKITPIGELEWQKSIGGSNGDNFRSLQVTADGGYILAGTTNSNNGDISGNHGNADGWVVKLSPNNILPVTLTSFTAQKQHTDVLLQWQTATEVNSKQFNIQRSSDGNRFTTIGVTPAAGNSTSLTRYAYTDVGAAVQPGTLYYRLEQVDKDGSKYYSKVAVIKNLPADVFTVMPNPVKSIITVQSKINATRATVQLSNMNGKVIYSSNKPISMGYLQIPAANLAAGNYTLTILANGDKYALRVVKE